MAEGMIELEALRAATRVRLLPAVVEELRFLAEMHEDGDKTDRRIAAGLSVLLDMHDKLEALRNG